MFETAESFLVKNNLFQNDSGGISYKEKCLSKGDLAKFCLDMDTNKLCFSHTYCLNLRKSVNICTDCDDFTDDHIYMTISYVPCPYYPSLPVGKSQRQLLPMIG